MASTGHDNDNRDELSRSLCAARRAAGFGQIEAARQAGTSQNKISRVENGKGLLTVAEAAALLTVYGVHGSERRRIMTLVEAACADHIDSRVILQRGAHHFQERVRQLDEQSRLVRGFALTAVLGILQSRAYAQVVFTQRMAVEQAAASIAVHAFILDTRNNRKFCYRYLNGKFLEYMLEVERKCDGSGSESLRRLRPTGSRSTGRCRRRTSACVYTVLSGPPHDRASRTVAWPGPWPLTTRGPRPCPSLPIRLATGITTPTASPAIHPKRRSRTPSAGHSTKVTALVRNCSANPSPRWSSAVAAVTPSQRLPRRASTPPASTSRRPRSQTPETIGGICPVPGISRADVLPFLASTGEQWDAIYSIWGALWFTDPQLLLPAVHDRLTPGGKLVFSHAPAVPGSYGIQGMYGNGFNGRRVWIYRWAYEPSTWADLLRKHGFVDIHARIEPAPQPDNVGTLLVEARRKR